MGPKEDYQALTEYLQELGHSAEEIDKILERVRRYEREMRLDSVMDSIGAGSLNIKALIDEALNEQPSEGEAAAPEGETPTSEEA